MVGQEMESVMITSRFVGKVISTLRVEPIHSITVLMMGCEFLSMVKSFMTPGMDVMQLILAGRVGFIA